MKYVQYNFQTNYIKYLQILYFGKMYFLSFAKILKYLKNLEEFENIFPESQIKIVGGHSDYNNVFGVQIILV